MEQTTTPINHTTQIPYQIIQSKQNVNSQNWLLVSQSEQNLIGKWKQFRLNLQITKPLRTLAKSITFKFKSPEIKDHQNTNPQQASTTNIQKLGSTMEVPVKINTPFCMFHPDGKPKAIWNIVLGILLIYTATIMPFAMAFIEAKPWGVWFTLDLILDCLFFVDVWVNILSAYYDNDGLLIKHRGKILIQYLKSWMLIDILACIPFSLIEGEEEQNGSQTEDEYNNLLRLMRLPRLYRLVRISRLVKMVKHYKNSEFLQRLQEFLSIKHSIMRLVSSFLTISLCVHIISCFWYFIARIEGFSPQTWVVRGNYQDESDQFLYFTSMYWAFTTLTTVGYGDIVPYTLFQKLFTIGWMLFGLYFLSFTIGSLSSMLSNIDSKQNVLVNKLAIIDQFAKEANLTRKIKHKLRYALRYSTEKTGFSWNDKQSIFNQLPRHLKFQIALAMHHGVAKNIFFFSNKDQVFISDIVPFLQPMFANQNEKVYSIGEYADQIYFVVKGKIKYIVQVYKIDHIKNGAYFGDIQVIAGVQRKYTALAEENSELLVMNKQLNGIIQQQYNRVWEDMKSAAEVKDNKYQRSLIKKELFVKLEKENNLDKFTPETFKEEVERRLQIKKKKQVRLRVQNLKNQHIAQLKTKEVNNKDLFWMMDNLYQYLGNLDKDLVLLSQKIHTFSTGKTLKQTMTFEEFYSDFEND